jgi:hypothetical protein
MASHWVNMNPFPTSQFVELEPHMPFFQAEKSVILSHANIVSRVEPSASLTGNNVSWFHLLKK